MEDTNKLHISGRGVNKDSVSFHASFVLARCRQLPLLVASRPSVHCLSGSSTPTSKPRYAYSLRAHSTVTLSERTCKKQAASDAAVRALHLSTGTSRSADRAHRHCTANGCIGAGAGTSKVYAVVGVLQSAHGSAASRRSPLNALPLRHSVAEY
jgi:hypothetical protein